MIKLQEILSKIGVILKKNIVVIWNDNQYVFPQDFHFEIPLSHVIKNVNHHYLGYNIYEIRVDGQYFYVCIQWEEYIMDPMIKLMLSMIETSITPMTSSIEHFRDVLDRNLKREDLLGLEEKYGSMPSGYLLLVEYGGQNKDEVYEIAVNSIDIQLIFDYKDHIIIVSKEENIVEACDNLAKNILLELFIECNISIGGKINSIHDLTIVYDNALEALTLKKKYGIKDYVLNYEKMYLYRIIASMDPKLKQDILSSIFHPDTEQIIDKEMEITIEAFLQNNLNLTDTANKIYVHRNTLLYRLEKIQKHTGFDLRKFEDSLLFKLAWLIRQENKINPFSGTVN